MRILLIFTCLLTLFSCNNQNRTKGTDITENKNIDIITDATDCESVEDTIYRETLNDIRFDGWTKKEWADNDYIRAVRRYIDAYNNGDIKDPYLDAYKEYIQGKFVIGDIKPGLWGGAFMYIVFFDHPDKTFSVLVYSDVDEETRTVSNYECRGLKYEDMDLGYSQEDILQFLKECPEQKMW
jgi:hypothetical protein